MCRNAHQQAGYMCRCMQCVIISVDLSLECRKVFNCNSSKIIHLLVCLSCITLASCITVFDEIPYTSDTHPCLTYNLVILSQNIELTTESSKEPVVCKVLDCDTVTQAKEKALDAIYRNTSFSVRPSIYEVDLGQFHKQG